MSKRFNVTRETLPFKFRHGPQSEYVRNSEKRRMRREIIDGWNRGDLIRTIAFEVCRNDLGITFGYLPKMGNDRKTLVWEFFEEVEGTGETYDYLYDSAITESLEFQYSISSR